MKQTPVQWLYDQIGDNAPHDYAAQIASYLEEAMKMETEQSKAITLQNQSESKEIPELSDEEINWEVSRRGWEGVSNEDIFIDGAKWYREQLKQRQ